MFFFQKQAIIELRETSSDLEMKKKHFQSLIKLNSFTTLTK